ncbi:uncharacterized protein LOC118433141 [Folsomia candida]|nr:uncharacterized protein LOC118433141 [Folsomia candida]
MPPASKKNLQSLKATVAKHDIINYRRLELELIKKAFITSGVTDFLNDRPHLWSSAFPRLSQMRYTAVMVTRKLKFFTSQTNVCMDAIARITCLFYDFLCNVGDDQLTKFIRAVTAWPFLPEEDIKVIITAGGGFTVHTCSLEIHVPETLSNDNILCYLRILVEFCEEGFGAA